MGWGQDWDQNWGSEVHDTLVATGVRAAAETAVFDSDSPQVTYFKTISLNHSVGAHLVILDEDEKPMWELPDIIDGGVNFDVTQSPDRTLDVSVLDVRGRLLSGAPFEEAAEARRFVRVIYTKDTAKGRIHFPLFTGPLSSGGLSRQGAQVSIHCAGKEALYLDPFVTWEAQNFWKSARVVNVIHDILYAMGERRFKLPELDAKLHKRFVLPRFSEAWTAVQKLAARIGQVPYFDGEGYLNLRPASPRTVGWVFDERQVLSAPEMDDDYTQLVNQAYVQGPNPDGPVKALRVPMALPKANPFSPASMARHGVPRRAVATEDVDWNWKIPKIQTGEHKGEEIKGKARDRYVLKFEMKKKSDLEEQARAMLRVPHKAISFDCLPVPHLRPGMKCRIVGEYEGQPVDETFLLRSGFFPLTAAQPMTVGTWKPVLVNWRRQPGRGGNGFR